MSNITLKQIRPWTVTQVEIEGFEDIHFEERDLNFDIYKVISKFFKVHSYSYYEKA